MTFPIPRDALDDRLGFIGTSGSGKTYNAGGAVERLLRGRARVVIVDPLGVWWGLRLLADGKAASPFDVAIFGGPHGDLPLTENAGALIGETAATMAESCIVDLSELGSKSADRRFMTAFLETIYRKAPGEPFHLVVDEADLFAPQKPPKGDETLLNLMEQIVRRGRVRGFIPWLISQRPAVLNKNVLSQVDGLIAFKLTASQDRDALDGWIEGQADKAQGKAIKDALPAMQIGNGVVWVPGRGVLQTAAFPMKLTFDSSRTPKRGEKKQATTALKPLDLGALKSRLATVEAETKANDPRALKAEVAKLKAELAKKPAPAAVPRDEAVAQKDRERAFQAGEKQGYETGYGRGWQDGERSGFSSGVAAAHGVIKAALPDVASVAYVPGTPPKRVPTKPQGDVPTVVLQPASAIPPSSSGRTADFGSANRGSNPREGASAVAIIEGLTVPQTRIMRSLAFWKSIGHEAPTREQIAAVAGYRPGSGNFNNLVGSLSSAGHTSVPQPGRLKLETACETLTADEAREKVWSIFENPQRRLVEAALVEAGDLSRDDLAKSAGYAPGSGNFNNICGSLTTMDVLQRSGQGRVQLSDWAREVLSP